MKIQALVPNSSLIRSVIPALSSRGATPPSPRTVTFLPPQTTGTTDGSFSPAGTSFSVPSVFARGGLVLLNPIGAPTDHLALSGVIANAVTGAVISSLIAVFAFYALGWIPERFGLVVDWETVGRSRTGKALLVLATLGVLGFGGYAGIEVNVVDALFH